MSLTTLSSTSPWRSAAGRPCSCCWRRMPNEVKPRTRFRIALVSRDLVRAERDDRRLARPAALDVRVLDRDVRVGAPGVDAVGAHAGHAQSLEPNVARAVEDGDADAALLVAAGHTAAAVEGEVGDSDVLALRDDERPVPLPRRRRQHRPRPRADEPGAAAELELVDLVAARGEAHGDVAASSARRARAKDCPGEASTISDPRGSIVTELGVVERRRPRLSTASTRSGGRPAAAARDRRRAGTAWSCRSRAAGRPGRR